MEVGALTDWRVAVCARACLRVSARLLVACVSWSCHAGHELQAAQGDFYCECGLHVTTCRCLAPATSGGQAAADSVSFSAARPDNGTASTVSASSELSLPATVSATARSYSAAQAVDVLAALTAECARSGSVWVDPSFPHSPASLFIDPAQPHQPSWLDADWVRVGGVVPSPALFAPPMSPDDIRQGRLGNCWFLSALAVLTLRQSLLFACFVQPREQPSGVYAVRFFRDGQQRVVLVDDFIPATAMDDGGGAGKAQERRWQPLFAQQREGGHSVWSLIIEKGSQPLGTQAAQHSAAHTAAQQPALPPAPSRTHSTRLRLHRLVVLSMHASSD